MHTLPIARGTTVRRLFSLGLALGLAGAALLLLRIWAEAAAPSQPALTVTVNSPLDAPDDNPGNNICHNAIDNKCNLRAALQELNAGSGGTINLPAGTYTLTNGAGGDLQIQKNISLLGAGPATTIIQGNPVSWPHRILRVQAGAAAVVSGVTISGGHLASANGGGIDVITSTLLLSGSVLTNNSAASGGGLYSSGRLTVTNSTIRNNQASADGGGLYINANDVAGPGGSLALLHSQVLTNTAQSGQGGGLYYNDSLPVLGFLTVDQTTLSGNQAAISGGGIFQSQGSATLTSSSLRANQTGQGGGIYDNGGLLTITGGAIETNVTTSSGGGLNLFQAALRLSGVTVRGNTATSGAGISSDEGRLDVSNSLILSNTSSDTDGGGLASSTDTGFFTNTVFSLNTATGCCRGGGGVEAAGSALTFTTSTFSNNRAWNGGGLRAAGGLPLNQTVLISSTVSGNQGDSVGGGVYLETGASMTLIGTDVTSNTAIVQGGGFNTIGHLSLTNSSVRHNTAPDGGGLDVLSGTVSLVGSTLSDNTATAGPGGGLVASSLNPAITLVNSTVSGNRATDHGGGLANFNGTIDLSNVTLAGNTADSDHDGSGDGGGLWNASVATATLRNSIVALNMDTGGQAPDCSGSYHSQGNNLVQSTLNCAITGAITGLDPKLKPLGNYGGPTETRDLLAGSPAIDAGNPNGCRDRLGNLLSLDQRGVIRPNGPFCDIGAVEGLSPLNKRLLLPLVER